MQGHCPETNTFDIMDVKANKSLKYTEEIIYVMAKGI